MAWHEAGGRAYERGGRTNAGNDSIMRCAPVGLLNTTSEKIIKYSIESSVITHYETQCTWSCAAVNLAIHELLEGSRNYLESVLEHLKNGDKIVLDALKNIRRTKEKDLKTSGSVINTLKIAFWCLMNTGSFE